MAASGGVGALTVTLGLDAAQFQDGLTRAQQQAKNFADSIKAIAVGAALGEAIAAGAEKAFDALKELTVGALEAADQLNNLSKNAGVSIIALGGIAFAASKTGGSLEDTAASITKLNKSIAEAASDSTTKAAQAFKAIGVSVTDSAGQTKSADQIFANVADKFATYADGPEKAAIALQLFGKAGAAQIALLDQGGQALQDNIAYYQRYSGVTQETADKASAFNDTLANVNLINKSFGQIILAEVLPVVQELANAYLHAKENSDLFKNAAAGLRIVLETLVVTGATVKDTFVGVGDTIGAYAAVSARLLQGDIAGAKEIGIAYREAGEERKKQLDAFSKAIIQVPVDASNFGNEGRNHPAASKPAAPKLPGTNTASDALKKQLDADIKLVQDFAKNQQAALSFANSLADVEYQKGNESQAEYFAQQDYLRQQALKVQLTEIDQEIALNQKLADNAKANLAQRTEAVGKVKLLTQQRTEALQAGANAETLALEKNEIAARQLADAYASLRASVLSASGDDFGAAQIRIAQQFAASMKIINAANGDPQVAVKQQRLAETQAAINKNQKDYSDLVTASANKEAQIYLDAQAAGAGELETLRLLTDSREKDITALQKVAAAQAEVAAGDPDNKAAQQLADQYTLALKKAKAEIDPLAAKINSDLESAFSDPFAEFLAGTKSAKDAFSDFAKNVLHDIDDIVAKDLAKSLFGDTGGSSGAGGFLSSLIGGGSKGGGGSGGSSGSGLFASGGLFGGIGNLFGNGSSGGFTGFGNLFGSGGSLINSDTPAFNAINELSNGGNAAGDLAALEDIGFANGGDPPLNRPSLVGENGPELFVPKVAGTVVPNGKFGGGRSVQNVTTQHIYISPPAGMSRGSSQQFAADVARRLSLASSRNN